MQSKFQEQKRAIQLRKKGYSYREIQELVAVSQSSLSLWLNKVKLGEAQQLRLAERSLIGQQLGAQAKRRQRLEKMALLQKEITQELPKYLQDPFFILGLTLYWAEGTKQKPWDVSARVGFSNTDHLAVLLMRKWLKQYGHIVDEDIIYQLHIHTTAPLDQSKKVWAELLGIGEEKIHVQLKRNDSKFRHNKEANYKGLIALRIRKSTWLNRRIELWTRGAAEYFLKQN